MPWIKKDFTYKVPNEFFTDDFSEGKENVFHYYGPEYITVHIDVNTGKHIGWCSWEPEELEVPVAPDEQRIVLDCKKDTLWCELVNEQGNDEFLDFLDDRKWLTKYKAPEGYEDFDIPVDLHLREVYDDQKLRWNFQNNEYECPVRTWSTEDGIDITKFTWQHFRVIRDEELKNTDGILDDHMPKELVDKWVEYKQLLRDAPEKLGHIPPFFASMMLPPEPENDALLPDQDEEDDIFEQIKLPTNDDEE